mgnify:CR=1 FL=1|jgi:excisionase family DNA binding protein
MITINQANMSKEIQMDITILDYLREIRSLLLERKADNWLDLSQTAKYTNLSRSTIRRSVTAGQLKASRKTGKLLFKRSDIDQWLKSSQTA